ncbi:MAG: hypothetical protein ACO3GP_08370 [Candidatus Limnocylindrus sp.]
MNQNTATREELLLYIVDQTSQENIEEWAERWLNKRYDTETLREMVREIHEVGEVRGDYDGD